MKIVISGAAGSNHSSMYDTRADISNASPECSGPNEFHTLAEIDPAAGTASLSHDLLLESGHTLSVTVLGPNGKPLAGTQISGLKDFKGVLARHSRPMPQLTQSRVSSPETTDLDLRSQRPSA